MELKGVPSTDEQAKIADMAFHEIRRLLPGHEIIETTLFFMAESVKWMLILSEMSMDEVPPPRDEMIATLARKVVDGYTGFGEDVNLIRL